MRRLYEWKDTKGNKVSTTSGAPTPSTSGTSSGSFKKRLNKLINYYGQHHPAEVDFITVNLLTNDTLDFTEYYDDRSAVRYNIYIGPATEAWRLKISMNGKLKDDIAGQGWPELLKTLRPYITVPVTTTPGYKELLTEWLDSDGKKVSQASAPPATTSSNKKSTVDFTDRFTKLCKHLTDLHGRVRITYLEPQRFSCRILDKNDNFLLVIKIDYLPETKRFRVSLYANEEIKADNVYMKDWDYLLDQFLACGIIKDKKLCESVESSIADDFKLYENLWN